MTFKLVMDTKTTHYVDGFHLGRYLTEKLGKSVELIESPNDTDYSISIEKGELESWEQETINTFLEDGYISMEYGYHDIFKYCANQGWLEPGNYVIRISW